MSEAERKSATIFPVLVLVGLGLGFAGSRGGATLGSIPLFLLAVGLILVIQWVAFVPAYQQQTEKFYDITGSITYISVTLFLLLLAPVRPVRSLILGALVIIWAVRLGTFLFRRVHETGGDGRFDEIKTRFFRFLNAWTLQGLWVSFTASAAFIAITNGNDEPFGIIGIIGLLVWIAGFAIEVIADTQKNQFRKDPSNKGKFIDTGLWAKSRHPNYFGEILLWIGVLIIALPTFQGWQWIGILSPIFVTLLLTRVSGIPLLENRADKKWGGQADYEKYKKETPILIPKL